MGGRGTSGSGSEEDLSSLPPHPQGSHLSLCQGQALRVTLDAGAGVSPNLFGPDPSGPSQAAATTRGADGGRIQMRRGLPCTDFSIPELPARTLFLEDRGPPGLASACPSHSSGPCHPQPTPPMNWLGFSGSRTGTTPGTGRVRAAKDQRTGKTVDSHSGERAVASTGFYTYCHTYCRWPSTPSSGVTSSRSPP